MSEPSPTLAAVTERAQPLIDYYRTLPDPGDAIRDLAERFTAGEMLDNERARQIRDLTRERDDAVARASGLLHKLVANHSAVEWEELRAEVADRGRRAARAERQRDRLAETLREVLGNFGDRGQPGEAPVDGHLWRSWWVTPALLARWRAVLDEQSKPECAGTCPRYATGWRDAVATLRDDRRYTNWWTSRDYPPGQRYWESEPRNHLADYLRMVGPDGPEVGGA